MIGQQSLNTLNDLDKRIKKAHRNGKCFVSGCNKKSIRSHVIAEKTLKCIADLQGQVLTWLPQSKTSIHKIRKKIEVGQTKDHLYSELKLVNINGNDYKVTEPLFCCDHDGRIFEPIEQQDIIVAPDPDPEQVHLLAYRSLCSSAFSTNAMNKALDPYTKNIPDKYQRRERLLAQEEVLWHLAQYEQMRLTHNYSLLECLAYHIDMPRSVAATYSFLPLDDDELATIAHGEQTLPVEDMITFSFLPDKSSNTSFCLISFLRTSQRASINLTRFNINTPFKEEQKAIFLKMAFESPQLYISPMWWSSLSQAEQELYKEFHFTTQRRHYHLFWEPYVAW